MDYDTSTDDIPGPTSSRARLAAIAGAGLIGATVGALWLGPVASSAQEDGSDDSTTTTEQPAEDGAADEQTEGEDCDGRGGPGGLRRFAFLDAAADAIGIERTALRDALQDGQTIAQVAEANGVDPATVVAAMVEEAQARLDERAENIEERITAIVNGEAPLGPGHPEGAPEEDADEEEDTGS